MANTTETPCREWQGSRIPSGYGRRSFRSDPHRGYAHRWVVKTIGFDKYGTPWDDDLKVLHECDNPPCFRYDHLFLGTLADNNADMKAKGRHQHGSRHGNAKLSEADVMEIRRRRKDGEFLRVIAADFSVGKKQISRICRGNQWKESL